jgi:hypothetical protein
MDQPYIIEQSSGSGWVAWIALILVIIIIIVVIVIAVFGFRDFNTIQQQFETWTLTNGVTTSPENFIGNPNSILRVASGVAAGHTINIQAPANISSILSSGQTVIFMIDNTASTQTVTLVPPAGGTITGVAGSTTIGAGFTGELYWISATSLIRVR